MTGNFESGVSTYIHATATVDVFFPVDNKGKADVCCYQCEYYRRNSGRCGINNALCAYPEKYVGQYCPLNMD